MTFTDEERGLIMEAFDLAQDELQNQIATCPDVYRYSDELDELVQKKKSLVELKGRVYADHVSGLPPVNWEGYYTRKGGTRWFWCVVVAHDQGKAVVRTKTSNYHAHSPDEFEFSKEPEGVRV